MEFSDALSRRFSCRGFLDKPVPASVMAEVLKKAQRAPSWGNTQPWRAYVAGGEVAAAIRKDVFQMFMDGEGESPDLPMPGQFAAPELMDRYRSLGKALFAHLEIGREDHEARMAHYTRNFKAFDAPALFFVTVPKKETSYVVLDAGAFTGYFCLAAADAGLGTVILAALARYPHVIRRHLPLGEDEDLVIGVAVGYADPAAKANGFRSGRVEPEEAFTLVGF